MQAFSVRKHRMMAGLGWFGACVVALLLMAAIQAAPAFAAGTTRYVANNGLDTSPCTKSMPCRSITRALGVAAPGDTIQVGPGVYGDIDGSGTVGDAAGEETPASYCMININNPVTLVSKDGAGSTVLDAGGSVNHLVCIHASGVVFGKLNKGFTVRNGLDGIQVDSSTTGVAVVGNLATGSSLFNIHGSGVVVKNDIAENSGFFISAPGGVVTGNLAQGVPYSAPGFWIDGGAGTAVTKNVAVDNWLGFWIEPAPFQQLSPAFTFTKNTASGNRQAGVWLRTSGGLPDSITLTQNNFFGNGDWASPPGWPANCGLMIDNISPSLTVNATGNFWGAASGPGTNPADLAGGACNTMPGVTLTTTPFATTQRPLYPPKIK